MECNCTTCDPSWKQEYQKWKDSVDEWAIKFQVHEFDKQNMLHFHMPIELLRLPCRKSPAARRASHINRKKLEDFRLLEKSSNFLQKNLNGCITKMDENQIRKIK